MERTLLVDSYSMIYRAYFAVPDTMRAPDGRQIHAAHGFLNMLARLIEDQAPTALACAWDEDWRPQWRVDLIPTYKSHRVAAVEEAATSEESIDDQIDLLAALLPLAGIAVVGAPDYEAEDVIGSLAARAKGPVAIVSGDRDLFQLVRDPDVVVLYPVRGVAEMQRVDETYIANKYGIPGRAYGDFAILRGDASDGLPGVRGVGDKSAAALMNTHGTLEAVVAAAKASDVASGPLAKVRGAVDYLEAAARVVRITDEAPIDTPDLRLGAPDPGLAELADSLGLGGPVARLRAAMGGAIEDAAARARSRS